MDQVTFMEGLVEPNLLRTRILRWADEEDRLGRLHAKAGVALEAMLFRARALPGEVRAGVTQIGGRAPVTLPT